MPQCPICNDSQDQESHGWDMYFNVERIWCCHCEHGYGWDQGYGWSNDDVVELQSI